MQRTPALIGAAALVVIVALFLILSGDEDDSTTTVASTTVASTTTESPTTESTTKETTTKEETKPDVPTIVIKDGEPVGGVQELNFSEGDDIRFTVESDVTDEIHLHGYDVAEEIEAGGSVDFDVPATLTGVFEVELEERVVPIAEITVNPS